MCAELLRQTSSPFRVSTVAPVVQAWVAAVAATTNVPASKPDVTVLVANNNGGFIGQGGQNGGANKKWDPFDAVTQDCKTHAGPQDFINGPALSNQGRGERVQPH